MGSSKHSAVLGSPRVSSIVNNKVGKAGTLMAYGRVGIEIVHFGRANNAKRHSVTLKELIVCVCVCVCVRACVRVYTQAA